MTVKSKTERAYYVFAIKQYADGTPWIMLEQSGENLSILDQGFLGLDFKEGISFEEAQKIAELLEDKIDTVKFTSFTK